MSLSLALFGLMAAAPAAQAKPPADPDVQYRVKKGDTLYILAERYFVRLEDYRVVQRLNRIADPRHLPVGRTLRVPQRVLKTEPIEGAVVALRGAVTFSGSGAATMGARVREGVVIATGAKAFVTVELPDSSRFSLPSNSRLGVARLRRTLLTGQVDRRFQLLGGRSDWDVTPSRGDRFEVKTPVATTAVRGTGFRVTYEEGGQVGTTGVLEGQVAVTGDTGETAVAAGAGLAVRSGQAPVAATLMAAPDLERAGAAQKEPELLFRAKPVAGASGYGFEIAADAGFVDRIAEARSETPEARFESIEGGTYFVRSSAFDANGIEGRANVYSFERRLNTLALDAPAAGSGKARKEFLFRWRGSGSGTALYRFVLARDEAGMDRVIDEAGLKNASITLSNLPDGVYYWRIWSTRFERGGYSETVSPPQKLQIGESR